MHSSQKRKRSYSATPQLNYDFQVLKNHNLWRASSQQNSSHHNHQIIPRDHQSQSGNFQHKVFPSPQALSSRRDHSRSYNTGNSKDVNIPSQHIDSQSYEFPSSQKSPKHGKKKDKKKHRAKSVPASSPFVPDASSTPNHSRRTKPVPVPIPIDPRLNENYIKAQAEAIRQRARETKAEQTFTSHVSSSSSASETSDYESSTDINGNEDSSSEESDSTPSPNPKRLESKKTDSKSNKAGVDAITSDKLRKKEKKKSKKDFKDSTETLVKDANKKKESNADDKKQRTGKDSQPSASTFHSYSHPQYESNKSNPASPPAAKPLPTTKQTNQILESNLFTTLTTIIPPYLMSQARTTLTTEVQSKAKTSHEANPYAGNSSGPSDRAVTLRAAHDLLVRLSVQRFIQSTASGGVNLNEYVNMESDLGRIAAERGKRIELLEMENRGLKSQVERAMGQVSGADDHVDEKENGDEDEDEGRREKKKRRNM